MWLRSQYFLACHSNRSSAPGLHHAGRQSYLARSTQKPHGRSPKLSFLGFWTSICSGPIHDMLVPFFLRKLQHSSIPRAAVFAKPLQSSQLTISCVNTHRFLGKGNAMVLSPFKNRNMAFRWTEYTRWNSSCGGTWCPLSTSQSNTCTLPFPKAIGQIRSRLMGMTMLSYSHCRTDTCP